MDAAEHTARAKDALLDLGPYLVGTKESAAAYDELDVSLTALSAALADRDARITALEAAIRHVIEDSPGTPDTVKGWLRKALEGA